MKKLLFMLLIVASVASIAILTSFKSANSIKSASANGTLYVKIKADGNKGSVHVIVMSASGTKLLDQQLAPGQVIEKTFNGLNNGPQSWYVVSFSWPQTDFHNMNASVGNFIASGFPVTANNNVASWQVAGTGAFGSIPILLL